MAGVVDPYRALGVPRSASLRQIKAAHRSLAKRYHPDSPTADPQRFLHVQEAYQLLVDPLRRREWDARHSPAPVRADEPAPARPRGRPRRTPPAREQAARNYTWSASEVPWWEDVARDGTTRDGTTRDGDGGHRATPGDGTRPPRQPPRSGQPPRPGHSARADSRPRAGRPPPSTRPPAGEPGREAPLDFDVYNRSSGAAWSAAARAYFRRADQDLPRRGSFHYRGTQPLTAARARVAADEAALRSHQATASTAAAAGWAGVAQDAEAVSRARAKVREEKRAAGWPSPRQRLTNALVGWLPMALLIGYGGPVAYGCQPLAGHCPAWLAPLQAVSAVLMLAGLLALPKLAYVFARATLLLAVGGGALLLGAWLVGVRAPQLATLPAWALALGTAVLAGAWLLVAIWLLADATRRPWVPAVRPWRGTRPSRAVEQ